MKKILTLITILIFISLQSQAQKTKDVLYLKNGSIIYGNLVEITDNQYKIQTSDGSLFIYNSGEVDKFVKEAPQAASRKTDGFGFALEAGFLVGPQNSQYDAPFSFNILGNYTMSTRNIISLGSGVEFIAVPFVPLFVEYKFIVMDKKSSPFIFVRGGKLIHVGNDDSATDTYYPYYDMKNFKGGLSYALGTGISWKRDDLELYLSFAYRFAATSYEQLNYSGHLDTYTTDYNRLEVKLGFKF